MTYVKQSIQGGVAEVRLERGKVNALNEQVVDELAQCFRELASDSGVRGILLRGSGKFFSFGFDIPEFMEALAPEPSLDEQARRRLHEYSDKSPTAFRGLKLLLRQPILEEIQRREAASIREFVEIWYSEETRRKLEKIKIHP